jgi:hypothetical protein
MASGWAWMREPSPARAGSMTASQVAGSCALVLSSRDEEEKSSRWGQLVCDPYGSHTTVERGTFRFSPPSVVTTVAPPTSR